jgi:deoxyribonuclease IV
MLKLGVHVSIAGGIADSIQRAKQLGANCMQIFARNPKGFRKSSLDSGLIAEFKAQAKKEKIKPIAIHIPYTLNLAAAKESFYKITIKEFSLDFQEAQSLGVDYLVTHMGSHKGISWRLGIDKVADALKEVLKNSPVSETMILLENTAGSGSWLGDHFDHHRMILEKINWPENVGLCLDTAHAWAAGYEINKPQGLEAMIAEIDKEIGLKRLKLIHLNDTHEKLGSKHDRHADIATGLIGEEGFKLILNHPALKKVPLILETPKEGPEDDIRNMETVRRLYGDK